MPKKLTYEDKVSKLKDINPHIKILEDVGGIEKDRLKCYCEKHDYTYYCSWVNLRRGYECKYCGKDKNKPDFIKDDVENKVKEISKGRYEVLEYGEYHGNSTRVKCKCTVHDYEYETSLKMLYKGSGCKICGNKAKGLDMSNDFLHVKLHIENNYNLKLISTQYINRHSKLDVKCTVCGENYSVTYGNICCGYGCPNCWSINRKLPINDAEYYKGEIAKNSNGKLEIIEVIGKYIGARTNVKYKCNECGGIFKTNIWRASLKTGCPKCDGKLPTGMYNFKTAERHKDKWDNITANFYILKCYNDETNECFYKIGVAMNGVNKRYNSNNMPYKYKILCEEKMSLYDAVMTEGFYCYENLENSYVPKIKFAGHTECFSKIWTMVRDY